MHTKNLSKSKLLSYRQCPKRLWLEIHSPDLAQASEAIQNTFHIGHEVGHLAQKIFDPQGEGSVIDFMDMGVAAAVERTKELLTDKKPIFEAAFVHAAGLCFVDALLPYSSKGVDGWHMVEVKSSTSVKDYQQDDIAIQSYIAKGSGLNLHKVSLAHIDSSWLYQGNGNYTGLLKKVDFTAQALMRHGEVQTWIANSQSIAKKAHAPATSMGEQCSAPYACPFMGHCMQDLPVAELPVQWLPKLSETLKKYISAQAITDMRQVPEDLLSAIQKRVRHVSMQGDTYFDAKSAQHHLEKYGLPAYFLDFETAQLTVPRWPQRRAYEQIPFQFSMHTLSKRQKLSHTEFVDLSGHDPAEAFATALLDKCPEDIPIFVYNAAFECTRIKELATRFVHLSHALMQLRERIVDLLPIVRDCYYHKDMRGSWSIKKVLPCMAPHLKYEDLEGVQNGGHAMQAYAESIAPETTPERKEELRKQLLEYCKLDTLALVEIWKFLMVKE